VKSPLVQRLRGTDVNHDAVVVFALEAVREVYREDWERAKRGGPPPVVVVMEILPLLESATITLSLTDDTPGKVVLQTANAESAAKVAEQAKRFPRIAKDELAKEREKLADRPEYMRAHEEPMMLQAEKLVNSMTVTRTAADVVITGKHAKEYAQESVRLICKTVSPPAQPDVIAPLEDSEPPKAKSKPRINGDEE